MITRIWADLIDVWLAVQRGTARLAPRAAPLLARIRPPARNAWRALPGDLVALAIMWMCGGLTASREVPRADGPPALLVEDPRAALYLDHVPLKPYAQTLGRYILARETLPDAIVRHELEHVGQWSRLGPLYLPVYGAASVIAILAGGNRYLDNIFEVAARARAGDVVAERARDRAQPARRPRRPRRARRCPRGPRRLRLAEPAGRRLKPAGRPGRRPAVGLRGNS